MADPTPEILSEAFTNALTYFQNNPSWDLKRVLAEATTTAQRSGVEGFKVYRDMGKAVQAQIAPQDLTDFSNVASRNKVMQVLTDCANQVTR